MAGTMTAPTTTTTVPAVAHLMVLLRLIHKVPIVFQRKGMCCSTITLVGFGRR